MSISCYCALCIVPSVHLTGRAICVQVQKAALFPSGQSTTFVFGFPQDGNDDGGTGGGDVVGTEKCDDSVSKDAARQAAPALECAVCNKMFTSLGDMRRHNLSRRHVQCVCVCVCVRVCACVRAWARTHQCDCACKCWSVSECILAVQAQTTRRS